ncbi:MAG TPA: YcnI family protein [Actinoplanes sp.]
MTKARRLLTRAGVVAAAGATVVLGFAGTAFAHVTVSPDTAPKGGDATVAFRVPNEQDSATTVGLEIDLPVDKPIAAVATEPIPGWTAVSTTSKLATPIKSDAGDVTQAVTKIVWKASAGAGIKPGQFQQFWVSLDSLPDAGSIEIKALQTYSDGTIVRWIDDPAPAGQDEPEHPAPVLTLVAGGDEGTAAASATSAAAPAPAAAEAAGSTTSGGNGPAVGLAIAGLVLGLIGAVTGLLAYRRAGARPSEAAGKAS